MEITDLTPQGLKCLGHILVGSKDEMLKFVKLSIEAEREDLVDLFYKAYQMKRNENRDSNND